MRRFILATVVLAFAFTSCGNKQKSAATADNGEGAVKENTIEVARSERSNKIAYISMDLLIEKYEYATELRNSFEAKYNKAERDLKAKAQKWEKDAMEYQEKAQKGLMTRSMMAESEARLGQEQQKLMQDQQAKLGELSEEEQVMNNKVFHAINDFVKEYNADFKYDMVLVTAATGPVLHAHPSMDITEDILAGLNEKYKKEKTANKK